MNNIQLPDMDIQPIHCVRCGYEWVPRKSTPPKVCSRCKSKVWWKPRKIKAVKDVKDKVKENE